MLKKLTGFAIGAVALYSAATFIVHAWATQQLAEQRLLDQCSNPYTTQQQREILGCK